MEFDDSIYGNLLDDVNACRHYLRQVALGMLKGDISKYPIFVAVPASLGEDFDLGLPVIIRSEWDLEWGFNASHLEDFVQKNIIHRDKVSSFISNYKNPQDYICLFIADEEKPAFTFIPYEKGPTPGKELLN